MTNILRTSTGQKADNASARFIHNDTEYEVRAARTSTGWKVEVLRGDTVVSPPYVVSYETAVDYYTAGWGLAVEALMAIARDDIENDRLPSARAA